MTVDDLFREAVRPAGRRATWSILTYIDAWRAFVDEVEAGYQGGLYEYEAELSVRDDLDRAMVSTRLEGVPEWNPFHAHIVHSDDRFRDQLGPRVRDGVRWWRARLPGRAGEELVEDAERLFGVEIGSIDD